MENMNVSDTRIGSSEFGDYQYARFVFWAFLERQSKGAFLRNVAVARTEANASNISAAAEYYCKLYGFESPEELWCAVLQADSDGISVAELHRRLQLDAVDRGGDLSLSPKAKPKR
jgi:hypothetical protein